MGVAGRKAGIERAKHKPLDDPGLPEKMVPQPYEPEESFQTYLSTYRTLEQYRPRTAKTPSQKFVMLTPTQQTTLPHVISREVRIV